MLAFQVRESETASKPRTDELAIGEKCQNFINSMLLRNDRILKVTDFGVRSGNCAEVLRLQGELTITIFFIGTGCDFVCVAAPNDDTTLFGSCNMSLVSLK